MNVLPELRDQLTRAVAAPRPARLPRLPVRVLTLAAAVAAAVAFALPALRGGDVEREATPPASAPAPAGLTVGCERGYVLRRRSVGPGDWRSRAIEVGPITFVGLAEQAGKPSWRYAPAAELARHLPRDEAEQVLGNGRDRYAAVGLNVLVEPNGTAATVKVDPSVRASVGLLTDLPTFGGYRASDGASEVTYAACPAVPPDVREVPDVDRLAFPLAIVVEGARCVPLLVSRDGAAPVRRAVSFGAGRCD